MATETGGFLFQHKAGSGAFETKKFCFAVVVTNPLNTKGGNFYV